MKAILHVDKEWGIGKSNSLMFRIPADMKFFKETTINNVVVMGSNTLKSFPQAKPLKERVNIVLYPGGEKRDDCIVVQSLDELFAEIKKYPPEKVFVIGGGMMYKTLLPYCTEVLVTKVNAIGNADTFFENLDLSQNFKLTQTSSPIITNNLEITFNTYTNISPKLY